MKGPAPDWLLFVNIIKNWRGIIGRGPAAEAKLLADFTNFDVCKGLTSKSWHTVCFYIAEWKTRNCLLMADGQS